MRISDWSSDVCSSDLSDTDAVNVAQLNKATASAVHYDVNSDGSINYNSVSFGDPSGTGGPVSLHNVAAGPAPTAAVHVETLLEDRKSAGQGKRMDVRGRLGCGRVVKKKKKNHT